MHIPTGSDNPKIDFGEQAPEFIHLRVIVRNFTDDEAIQAAAARNSQEDVQRLQLVIV
jgi:hypothetical protein